MSKTPVTRADQMLTSAFRSGQVLPGGAMGHHMPDAMGRALVEDRCADVGFQAQFPGLLFFKPGPRLLAAPSCILLCSGAMLQKSIP